MSAEAIYNVTIALRERLKVAVTGHGISGNVFVGPPNEVSSGADLILVVYRNSLPFDLYFLVTVGATPAPGEEPLLRALGYTIQALQLDPNLVGMPVGQETIHVTLEPLSTEESSRIWALFPTANYRTSVAYVASPVWIDPPQPEIEAKPVTTDWLNAGALEVAQ
jgi:hypothetical protein